LTLPHDLLVDLQRRLETLYALEPQAPVTDFVIPPDEAGAYPGGGSRTLVTEQGDEIKVGVVFDETTGATFPIEPLPRARQAIIDAGGLIPYTRRRLRESVKM